tara:strand:- start:61 stop:429 length:369 start_codon:yes stop_codon:yes gene_type:complete
MKEQNSGFALFLGIIFVFCINNCTRIINMTQELKQQQYISLCELLWTHKDSFTLRQRDALKGMQRKVKKNILTEEVTNRIDGLFRHIQKQHNKAQNIKAKTKQTKQTKQTARKVDGPVIEYR